MQISGRGTSFKNGYPTVWNGIDNGK